MVVIVEIVVAEITERLKLNDLRKYSSRKIITFEKASYLNIYESFVDYCKKTKKG